MKLLKIIFFLTLAVNGILAQDLLSLEEAKNIALSNNYQIKLGEKQLDIARVSTKLQQVGYAPTVRLNAGIQGQVNNSSSKFFANPDKVTNWFAPSWDANAGAAANYLLWDGHRLDNKVKQHIAQEKLASISIDLAKENIVYRVEATYLNIARMYESRVILNNSIGISRKRRLRAQYGVQYGTADKLALLNADVDLNRDSINLIKFDQQVVNAKRNLNLILNRDIATKFEIDTSIKIINTLSLDQFYKDALTNNAELRQARQNLVVSSFDKEINDGLVKPMVSANASYGINYFDKSDVNPIDYSLGDGLRLGLTASWTILDGGRTKRLNELADLKIDAQQLQVFQLEEQIKLEISNAWGEYQNALLIYDLEKNNVLTAQENFIRTEERFKSGQINSIIFRQAQQNLLLAKLNLASAKYDAKLVELDLRLAAGLLDPKY